MVNKISSKRQIISLLLEESLNILQLTHLYIFTTRKLKYFHIERTKIFLAVSVTLYKKKFILYLVLFLRRAFI